MRMIVDGKAMAGQMFEKMRTDVALLSRVPKLVIISCAPNFETERYLALKQKKAQEVGIMIEVLRFDATATTEDMLVANTTAEESADGIIVQLPLPSTIDTARVLASIPPSYDVDALNPVSSEMLSPVVGAIREILNAHDITPEGKQVTIIGCGKLVGLPAQRWCTEQGAHVSVVTKDTTDIAYYTRPADIIVCGAGVPGLLTPDMVKEGVVILDAGTTEDSGVLRGDADPSCAEKAHLYTPVPGGIGPLTIAILLRNVVDCAQKRQSVV